MTDQDQIIAQLTASVRELELRLQATIEVYSDLMNSALSKIDSSSAILRSIILNRIDEAHAKLRKG